MPNPPPWPDGEDDQPLEERGRSLGLRLLALLGAFSVLMIGVSSLAPLLQSLSPSPQPERPPRR